MFDTSGSETSDAPTSDAGTSGAAFGGAEFGGAESSRSRWSDPELSEAGAAARKWMRLADTALCGLAGIDTSELAPEDLREVTLALERIRRLNDAAEAHTLAELDACGITDLRCGLATSKWLADRAALPAGVARQRLAIAKKLAALPVVDAALSAGRIGFDHARVFADVINERNHAELVPLLEDLIDACQGTVFTRWRDDVTALAALLDPDGSHDPAADLARNRLTLSPSTDFMLIRGELTGEHALSVHDTLNAIADELFHQYSNDRATCAELEIPNRATLLALALEEICRRALAVDRDSTRPPRIEASLTIQTGNGAAIGADRTSVTLAVWQIRNSVDSPIPTDTIPTFLCDATFHAALIDSLGVPIDMGRATRTPTAAQRRALVVRDGGCTFPGCDCPSAWTDAHHLAQWNRDHGSTDLDNLVLVCRRHHRVAHREGWAVRLDRDGTTRWTTPDGTTHAGQRHLQRAGP